MVIKLAFNVSSKPSMEATSVAVHKEDPIPAGNPGAAIVNSTTAGQIINMAIQLISSPKTVLSKMV